MLKGQEEHTHNHIHHHKNEIGVAISPVYFFGENESKFAVGLGVMNEFLMNTNIKQLE